MLNAVIEFAGPGVASLSMEERLTIANMTTEWGALAGWFPVRRDHASPSCASGSRGWRGRGRPRTASPTPSSPPGAADPPRRDPDAVYAAEIVLDLAEVTPHVSGPHSVQVMTSLAEHARSRR